MSDHYQRDLATMFWIGFIVGVTVGAVFTYIFH